MKCLKLLAFIIIAIVSLWIPAGCSNNCTDTQTTTAVTEAAALADEDSTPVLDNTHKETDDDKGNADILSDNDDLEVMTNPVSDNNQKPESDKSDNASNKQDTAVDNNGNSASDKNDKPKGNDSSDIPGYSNPGSEKIELPFIPAN